MHAHTVPAGAPNLMFNWISGSLTGRKKQYSRVRKEKWKDG